jgi:hypothetical protein
VQHKGLELLEALQTGLSASVIAVSNGSFKETYGTAAWTIGTEDQCDIISGKAICPGGAQDQSAYRSELTGLYAILAVVNQLCIFYEVQEGHVEIGCDGSSAFRMALAQDPILTFNPPDYDIIGAIYSLRIQSKVTWTLHHMKGHQDDISDELDLWAQRNVLMDQQAKGHLRFAMQSPRHFDIDGEPWQLWVKGTKLIRDISSAIYSAVHDKEGETYWSKKNDYPPEVIKEVDWQLICRTLTSIPQTRRHFLSKHIAGMCGVGRCMKRWKEWPTDSCPRCVDTEDAPHVWRCKAEGTSEIWDKSVASLDSLLRKLDTDPTLHHLLLLYLKSWWSGEGVTYVPPREFQDLIEAQNRISWQRLFEGWLSVQWTRHQQHFYNIIKSSRTGQRWATAIVQKLWDTAWDL